MSTIQPGLVDTDVVDEPEADRVDPELGVPHTSERLPGDLHGVGMALRDHW